MAGWDLGLFTHGEGRDCYIDFEILTFDNSQPQHRCVSNIYNKVGNLVVTQDHPDLLDAIITSASIGTVPSDRRRSEEL